MYHLKGLYGLTDSNLMPDDATLQRKVQAALAGGMNLLQYRDKSGDPQKRLRQAKLLKLICDDYGVPLLINDDVFLAGEVGAQGVHLGRHDESIQMAREQLGPDAIIGASCYNSLERAASANLAGATYIAFGRFFTSETKPDAKPAQPAILGLAQQSSRCPIVAIGGITVDNAPEIIRAGADMIAVAGGLFGSDRVSLTAQQFTALFPEQVSI